MRIDRTQVECLIKNAAGQELLSRFNKVDHSYKLDGSVITEADLAMQARLAKELVSLYPNTVLLGEEMPVEQQQNLLDTGEAVWCLDPLDGTSNYSAGIPYFSVSLALLSQGKVIFGLVYDPVRDEMFVADEDGVSFLNGIPLQLKESGRALKKSTAMIDFKRLPESLAVSLVASPPYASQRSYGSVALDWCWLAAGRGHVYLHGRSQIWDYAAGHYIFTCAGGLSCSFDGGDVFQQQLVPRSAIAAVDKSLFDNWFSWISQNNI